MIDLVEREY